MRSYTTVFFVAIISVTVGCGINLEESQRTSVNSGDIEHENAQQENNAGSLVTTSIDSGPTSPTPATGASFFFSASATLEVVGFECRLDEGAWETCLSPHSYIGLDNGQHHFDVRAEDSAGSKDPEPPTWPWTIDTSLIDTTPPITTIYNAPSSTAATNATEATFEFACNEPPCKFECRLDTAAFASCTSPAFYDDVTTEGQHGFAVRASDATGNIEAEPAIWLWTVDLTPPYTYIDSGPIGVTSSTSATFTFSCSDEFCTYACRIDGEDFAICTSPYSKNLALGDHTFELIAIDEAGNPATETTTRSWTIE